MAINYKHCPRCASIDTVKILYGMPTVEANELAEARKIRLGGCCMILGGAEYYCNDCENEWNREQAIEAAYEKIKGLKALVGGFFGSSYRVEIDVAAQTITWSHWNSGEEVDRRYIASKNTISKEELLDALKMVDLLNWKSKYIEPGVLDGTSWSVELIRDRRKITKYGQNKYPEQWGLFCEFMSKFTEEDFS